MKLGITLAVLAAALLVPASAEAGTSQVTCAKKSSRTVQAGKQARVFFYGFFYGCLYRTDQRFYLGGGDCRDRQGKVAYLRLAGAHVAYRTTQCFLESGYTSITVASLRDGRKRYLGPYLALPPPSVPCMPGQCRVIPGAVGFHNDLTALKLKPNGSVAWIGRQRGRYKPTNPFEDVFYTHYEVRKAEGAGESVLLDSGPDIDPGSLRLQGGGSTIYWTKGGVESSAPLQ